MARFLDLSRNVHSAIILGCAALSINIVSYLLTGGHTLQAGNIFFFCCSGALGVSGALISTTIGLVPETLWSGQYLHGLRVILLCLAIGYCSFRMPRVPAFFVTLFMWLALFGPVLIYLANHGIDNQLTSYQELFYVGLTDLFFTMISSALLLSPELWGMITQQPRHLHPFPLLIHTITIVATLSMLGAWSTTGHSLVQSNLHTIDLSSLMTLLMLSIAFPALVAWALANKMTDSCQELFGGSLLRLKQSGNFSGLLSHHWRRRTTTDLESFKQRNDSNTSISSPRIYRGKNSGLLNSDQGICALNRNGTITFVNRRFCKYTGVTNNEVIGKNIASIGMNEEACTHIMNLVESTFLRGPRTTELKLNELPDKLRFFEVVSLLSDAFEGSAISDGPDSIIVTIKDITDRRTVEAHLLQAQKLESLGKLVSNIAHSFNNTLTAIIGQASFTRHSQNKAQTDSAINEILKAAQHAGGLVKQLLDFAEGRPAHIKVENFGTLVEERLEFLQKMVGTNYEIVYHKPETDIGVKCDANLMTQALTNIILNCRDAYRNNPGQIRISLDTEHMDEEVTDLHVGARPGNFARLRIKDFGMGMNREIVARAFDPLFTTKASSGHSGLGLSIVYAIVRAHDGFLAIESHPEKGTIVSVYIPLHDLHKSEAVSSERVKFDFTDPKEKLGSDMLGNHEKILLVEDEEAIRTLVARMLSTLNYEVTSCCNGPEALQKCQEGTFDLVLVDMVMPRMHGTDLISQIKENNGKTKTMLMTGYGVTVQAQKDQEMQVIPKPFDLETLARAVRGVLA